MLLLAGCVDKPTQGAGERLCGVTEGIFRSRWWNFYERGLSYAGCRQWTEAEADLRQAIAQRSDDQRRARTYGMHFLDYFPHRELGIVLYRQGKLEASMRELETSLSREKSAKAELYLDRVRKDWIEQQQRDRIPPVITIDSPAPDALVQGFTVTVRGSARDDTFVKSIQVNGIPVRIDLSAPQIPFAVEVPLRRSGNTIEVLATDLTGRQSRVKLEVNSDREGPVLGIQSAEPGGRLKGYVDDPSGLAEVRINGEKQTVPPSGEMLLDQSLPSAARAPLLLIEAVDRAGNFTTAQLDFTEQLNRRNVPPLLLAARTDDRGSYVLWADVGGGLSAGLFANYRTEGGAIYRDHIYLEGRVTLPGGVASVTINGVQLLRRPERTVFFTYRLALTPGDNRLLLEAREAGGHTVSKEITLTRVLKPLERREARYHLALVGQRPADRGRLGPLWRALSNTPRFAPSGDGPLVTSNPSKPLTPADAAALARPRGADGVLLVQTAADAGSIEYSAQWVDAAGETLLFPGVFDAYGEYVPDTSSLAGVLLGKVRDALPILEGELLGSQGARLNLRLPGAEALPVGVPLTLYRDGTPRRDSDTDADLGSEQQILGRARLLPPGPQGPRAELVAPTDDLGPGDQVQVR